MVDLPTGTLTMVFSDIEGSTILLSRLGPAYADALDGQRQLLRRAWAAHGGTEMGTEGDSFFVVFNTTPEAVAAVVQAQREVEAFDWPAGERVRVRMGVHTGNPTVHDGGYVGMDVHRAARIAGAAHGGQVILSSATMELAVGSLPKSVHLLSLGSHYLKDIAQPERLYQLAIDGLEARFPPLRSLGAETSLPRPVTRLVGRDGELAELTTMLGSPGIRLVTLTGPGGTGKTTLASGLAQELVGRFPDGAYFVPLASASTPDVMWTTIAETLNVAPENRKPLGVLAHLRHRSVLLVLDNLEQIASADAVVADLLEGAEHVVVICTTRRPLHVAGEYEHPVPPLEFPDGSSLAEAHKSGAVQLFVQLAQMVRPSLRLTNENAADVVAICKRLDGLPLAIKLAAARSKLLSPKALLTRLDTALDITATGIRGPARQRTLRDTVAWSYELLTSEQQMLFRRLSVFVGGADLEAVAAVTALDDLDSVDCLDAVIDLVDASLVTVSDTCDGEPRVGMLETIRAFAVDMLERSHEAERVRQGHARYFLQLAEQWEPRLGVGDQHPQTRARFETDHDNFRAALSWAQRPSRTSDGAPDRALIGLRLCLALFGFWTVSNHIAEAKRWLECAIHRGDGDRADGGRPELARCLEFLAWVLYLQGDIDAALRDATRSVDMWRGLRETTRLATALEMVALTETARGHFAEARQLYSEAIAIAREAGDDYQLIVVLFSLAGLELEEKNHERGLEVTQEVLTIAQRIDEPFYAMSAQATMADALRATGRVEEARNQMHRLIPEMLRLDDSGLLLGGVEMYATVLVDLGDAAHAVRMLGAADAARERSGETRAAIQEADLADTFAKTRAALSPQRWNQEYQAGRAITVEDALAEAHAVGQDEVSRG